MNESRLLSRREFIQSASFLGLSLTAPGFLLRTAGAQDAPYLRAGRDERVLVVVQLAGGNDGLNTIVPHADDAYHRLRPRLALRGPEQLLRLDDLRAANAELRALLPAWERGQLAIVEGVGYPNPDRSHFRSTEIWETAVDADASSRTGWIGRYLDANCAGAPDPTAAIAIMNKRPQSFEGAHGLGIAVAQPDAFGFLEGRAADTEAGFKELNRVEGREVEASGNASLDFLRQTTLNATMSSSRVRDATRRYRSGVDYPRTQLGQGLQTVAKMLAGRLPTRLFYVSHGGFDTHANQQGTHQRLLRELAEALAAFQQDLDAMGEADRVLVMTFSEFGRRPAENASGGTDHGTAAPMFLMGRGVRGGLHARPPSLVQLDDNGDLEHTTDFRSVYAAVLEGWFGVATAPVLGRPFAPLAGLVRG